MDFNNPHQHLKIIFINKTKNLGLYALRVVVTILDIGKDLNHNGQVEKKISNLIDNVIISISIQQIQIIFKEKVQNLR